MSKTERGDSASWLCVVCGVAERDGSVLLVRQRGKNDPEPVWTLPGGVVEAGETLEQALRREVLEETGLRIDRPDRLLWTVEAAQSLSFVFAVECAESALPKHSDPDGLVKEASWVPRTKALELLGSFPRRFRRMWEPTVAVLSGTVAEGSVWTYSIGGTEDELTSVVPPPPNRNGPP